MLEILGMFRLALNELSGVERSHRTKDALLVEQNILEVAGANALVSFWLSL